MSNFFKDYMRSPPDFWDMLLYKYYGKLFIGVDKAEDGADWTAYCYHYNGVYYMDKVVRSE